MTKQRMEKSTLTDIHDSIENLRGYGSVKNNFAILAHLDKIQEQVEELVGSTVNNEIKRSCD